MCLCLSTNPFVLYHDVEVIRCVFCFQVLSQFKLCYYKSQYTYLHTVDSHLLLFTNYSIMYEIGSSLFIDATVIKASTLPTLKAIVGLSWLMCGIRSFSSGQGVYSQDTHSTPHHSTAWFVWYNVPKVEGSGHLNKWPMHMVRRHT